MGNMITSIYPIRNKAERLVSRVNQIKNRNDHKMEHTMKSNTTIRLTIASLSLLCVMVFEAKSQQLREMQPLAHQDFECLQSLDCAQTNPILQNKGWTYVLDETVDVFTQELTASMKSEQVNFNAIYDRQGNLIRARYKRNNVSLPRCLLIHLSLDQYEEWHIAESELLIKDFNPVSARYKVKLINNTAETFEEFDYDMIAEFHDKYEGPIKLCLFK